MTRSCLIKLPIKLSVAFLCMFFVSGWKDASETTVQVISQRSTMKTDDLNGYVTFVSTAVVYSPKTNDYFTCKGYIWGKPSTQSVDESTGFTKFPAVTISASCISYQLPKEKAPPLREQFYEVPVAGNESTWPSTGPMAFWRSSADRFSFCALSNTEQHDGLWFECKDLTVIGPP
ncbi:MULTISPECIES: hypothetical protein [unclassified Bradyrhizobium]|uniref:hypothetical protein n=1 Tax=unclassified Bradyrhizobium TaxID=2631580 RepID=UPI0028EDAF49|nr:MULTISPECIES: hypothetical protein [unclassified Bradyrhizobium]